MLVRIIERSMIIPHLSQPADSGDGALLCLGPSVGYLFLSWWEDEGKKASFSLLGCPLINIIFLINIKAFSAAHFEELPTIHFFLLVIGKPGFIMKRAVFFLQS